MHFLINYTTDHILNELVSNLYNADALDYLLQDDPHTAAQRKAASEMNAALERAANIISEVSDDTLAFP